MNQNMEMELSPPIEEWAELDDCPNHPMGLPLRTTMRHLWVQ